MPKISVLVSVYNTKESYLREAIECILNQTYKDFEFIIINDGSTNNAEDVILSYNDSRIKYIKNTKNLGFIKSLNRGLGVVSGEYIARFDSDDVYPLDRLQIQCDFLDNNPDIGVVSGMFETFPKKRYSQLQMDNKLIKEGLLVQSNQMVHAASMIRKSVLDENNIRYDESALYVEDYKIWLDLINKTKFANIDKILLKYRRHNEGTCSQNEIKQNINAQKIMFDAQAKYFGLELNGIIEILDNLYECKKVTADDLIKIIDFTDKVKAGMSEKNFETEYKLNHKFAKFALKQCKKNINYFKYLLSGKFRIFFLK